MNKYDETLENLHTLLSAVVNAESSNINNHFSINSILLNETIRTIEFWKSIASEFVASITIQPGESKPKISVDIERFLGAQYVYESRDKI